MIIRTEQELGRLEDLVDKETILAYDLETDSLNPRTGKIVGIALASDTWAGYVVLREWNGSELVEVVSKNAIMPILNKLKYKRLLGHNFSFDCRFTRCQLQIDLAPALHCDTMLLAHTLDENKYSYGLKELGVEYFGAAAADEKADLLASIKANGGSKNEYYKASTDVMAKYAMQDVRLTYKLWKLLDPKLDAEELRAFFYTDEVMPLLKHVTIDMEYRGVPVDVPALQTSQAEIAADIEALENKIQTAIKPFIGGFEDWYVRTKYPYKLTGPFKDKLASKIAPPGWPRTDSGGYSFNREEIRKAIKRGELAANSALERYVCGLDHVSEELIREIQVELATEANGTHLFNLQSKDHLKRLFFGTSTTESVLKETPLSKTPKGAPQVDDDFLDVMAKKYSWAEDLRTFNRLNKIKSTYIDAFLEQQENGIFYPQFFQHRTVSGRYGSNLQQMPRKLEAGQAHDVIIKYNNKIRDFLIAGDGHLFIGDDYESLEPKVFSHVTGDEGLLNIFRNGDDFYSTIAIATENLTQYSANKNAENYLGKVNKQKRQTAKAYSLGVPYGLGGYKLSFELGISKEEGERLVSQYVNAFPKLKQWMEDSKRTAIKTGKIRTQLGRVRHMPELPQIISKYGEEVLDSLAIWKKYHDVPSAYDYVKKQRSFATNYINNARNFQIQSLAASIVNRAAIAMTKAFLPEWGAYIVAQVHDEIVVRCKAEFAEQVASVVQDKMENTTKLLLPLVAEPCIAAVYGQTK